MNIDPTKTETAAFPAQIPPQLMENGYNSSTGLVQRASLVIANGCSYYGYICR
jgi:hypothetical protein